MYARFDLDAFAERALAAALDASRWGEALASVGPAFNGAGVTFGAVDGLSATVIRADAVGFDADMERFWAEYHEEMAAHDPTVRAIAGGAGPRVLSEMDGFDPDDKGHQTFADWQEDRLGVRHHLSFVTSVGHVSVGFGVHRTRDAGPADRDGRERMRALGQRLSPALQLGLLHADLVADAFWDGLTTQQGKAACLLDDRGRMLRVTPSLDQVLRKRDGLTASGERMAAMDARANDRLAAVLRAATTPRSAVAGAVILPRAPGPPAVLSIYPLDRAVHRLRSTRVAAVAVLTDLTRRSDTVDTHFQQAFGLTPQEARVAAGLANGDDLDTVAALLGISRETVRVHLKNLFKKTGTRRQSELVRLMTLLLRQR